MIAFPTVPQVGISQEWWRDLTGEEPESVRKVVLREDRGAFQGGLLVLTIDPVRVVWTALPTSPDLNFQPGTLPALRPFPESSGWFLRLMQRWLRDSCPEINRLGFSARLARVAPSGREEAYRLLDEYLPAVQVSPDTHDFQYRINRKRSSAVGIEGLRINRLSAWSCVKFQVQIQTQLESGQTGPPLSVEGPFSCVVELDVNTEPEFGKPLPHDKLPELFAELVQLAAEIAEKGDVP